MSIIINFLYEKKGFIDCLERDVYFFVDEKEKLIAQEISFLIYQPSYLSMELI